MTAAQQTPHPAPWPLLDLDVAKIRAAGNQAVPFRQFILKVHSRCNLSCSYCYVYEMADQGWRGLPRRMSPAGGRSRPSSASPSTRNGTAWRASTSSCTAASRCSRERNGWPAWSARSASRVPAQVNVTIQTNGTLLDRAMLTTLKNLGIRVGVSLDGDAEATGRHRRYANGRNSFDAVADGLDLLRSPEFRDCYGGILCTIDVENDPVSTYEALLKFAPPALDLLLPHANWSCAPPGDGYADWLISVFDRWYTAPRQETRIRLFSELIQLVLGHPGEVEGLGLLPSTLVVVDTDGSVKQLDSLSSAYPGAADMGLDVMSGGFDDALDHPTTVARQIGAGALAAECLACPVMDICGGGLYPHRFRDGEGFRQSLGLLRRTCFGSSATCGNGLLADLSRAPAPYKSYGSISAVSRVPRVAARASGCSRVSVRSYPRSTSARRRSPWGPLGSAVPGGHLVPGEVGPRHQRVRVIVAEVQTAVVERFPGRGRSPRRAGRGARRGRRHS